MKTVNHFGPDLLTNSEIHRNTEFGRIWCVFNITRKLMKEHSEEILKCGMPGIFITIMEEVDVGQCPS